MSGKDLFKSVKKVAETEVKHADFRETGQVIAINGLSVTVRLMSNQVITCKRPAGFAGRVDTMVIVGRNKKTQQFDIFNTLYTKNNSENLEIAKIPGWYIGIPWTNVVDGSALFGFNVDALPPEANNLKIEVQGVINNGATKVQVNFQGYNAAGTQLWTHALAAASFPVSGVEMAYIKIDFPMFRLARTLYYSREFISTVTFTFNGASVALGANTIAEYRFTLASSTWDSLTKYRVLWSE